MVVLIRTLLNLVNVPCMFILVIFPVDKVFDSFTHSSIISQTSVL